MRPHFSIVTQDVIFTTNEEIYEHSNEIVVCDYNKIFLIVGGKCNVKDEDNTKLINENFTTES